MTFLLRVLTAVLVLMLSFQVSPSLADEPGNNVAAVVQAHDDAYNAHDIRAFMETLASDAEIYEYPAKLLMKGVDQIRTFYQTKRFNDSRLHVTIVNRIVMGDVVVDHEKIAITYPEGPGRFEAIAIFEVRDSKIQKVTLVRGAKSLDSAR